MDRNLHAFLVVAETQNITAAAEQLNITQPTLTKRLQQLESVYACKLFDRLPRGVKLSPYGKRLLPRAKRIEHEYLQAQEELSSIHSGHLEELRIGAGPLFHMRYLGPAFEILRKEFPDTSILLIADQNNLNLPRLREGKADIVFGISEPIDNPDQIGFHRLTTVEHGLALSASHPLAHKPVLNIEDLSDMSWAIYSDTSEYDQVFPAFFETQGLAPPKFAIQSTSFALSLQMVANSDYVMPLPIQLEPILDLERLRIVRTSPPISVRPAGAFVRHSSLHYPIVTRLIDIVRQAANP